MARLTEEVAELKEVYAAKYGKVIAEQEAILAELKKIAKSYNLGISLFKVKEEDKENDEEE